MPRVTRLILMLTLLLSPAAAHAQKKAAPKLPRVLILGDWVYNQASRSLQKDLKGKANVTYASWDREEIADTTTALRVLDRLLGRFDRNGKPVPPQKHPKWDLIHFNFGLGDLIHRAPHIKKSVRVLPIHAGGVPNTDPKRYEANLRELVERLKPTGAKLVWASTTPIRHSRSNVFKLGSEVEYNAIAARVMKEHGVPINDMYTHVKELINMDKPAGHGADPFNFDKKPIHPPIAKIIYRELNIE